MRIKHKECPKFGDYREKEKFLFFPKRIGNETRWLEVVQWGEKYGKKWIGEPSYVFIGAWKAVCWIFSAREWREI